MKNIEQIVTSPELIPYPFTFSQLISRQGYKIIVAVPESAAEQQTALEQAARNNPAQVALARAAGTP